MEDDRIVLWAPRGQHIPLKCAKCGQTGSTKNISYIGARTIFVDCSCSIKFLEVVPPENAEELIKVEMEKMEEAERFEEFSRGRGKSMHEIFDELKAKGEYSFDRMKEELRKRDERIRKEYEESR